MKLQLGLSPCGTAQATSRAPRTPAAYAKPTRSAAPTRTPRAVVHVVGSINRGILCWGPYMKDPIILGPYQVPKLVETPM